MVGSTSELVSNLFNRSLKYFSLQKCLDNLNFQRFGISSFEINKLKISTLPIVNVPDVYLIFCRDFREVFMISLSSFFSSLDPIISKPT